MVGGGRPLLGKILGHLFPRVSEFMDAKNLPPTSLDFRLVNFSLWKAFQQKLYCQDYRDTDHMKCVPLQWPNKPGMAKKFNSCQLIFDYSNTKYAV